MLPAPKPGGPSLADVLKSGADAIAGRPNRLGLPRVDTAIIVLVDGLGADALRSRSGHARTMSGMLGPKSIIESGFPTTTAAAIASLTTGVAPGQHGIVGYTALDTANDRVVNQLSGWDDRIDPLAWQLEPTIFEAVAEGAAAIAIGPSRFDGSGFSQAVLRGARYVSAESIDDRMLAAAELARQPGPPALIYVYVPELDMASHAHGTESHQWTHALEVTDRAIRELAESLSPQHGMLVTADHGALDVPRHQHRLYDMLPGLLDGVRFVAGDPRCLQIHFEPDAPAEHRSRVTELWRASESQLSWVATRDEAVAAGWFGGVRAEVMPRIGDLIVAARKNIAYYNGQTATDHARAMVGQHGSWSPA
ncbi:MAG: alkaline phosphatase family protein, partial [Salinibacterium sp.]